VSATRLRHARREDLDALLALLHQLNPGDVVAPRERLEALLEQIIASEHFAVIVVTQDERVVATCYLNVIPNLSRGGASYAVVENVVVERSLRGSGLGQQVVRFALDEAWLRGCYKALLQTGERDPRVHRFYAACGFSASEKTGFVARPPCALGKPPA
jgi:N-acetylglutamate synthase-like GNAT family acetyltransferase